MAAAYLVAVGRVAVLPALPVGPAGATPPVPAGCVARVGGRGGRTVVRLFGLRVEPLGDVGLLPPTYARLGTAGRRPRLSVPAASQHAGLHDCSSTRGWR